MWDITNEKWNIFCFCWNMVKVQLCMGRWGCDTATSVYDKWYVWTEGSVWADEGVIEASVMMIYKWG